MLGFFGEAGKLADLSGETNTGCEEEMRRYGEIGCDERRGNGESGGELFCKDQQKQTRLVKNTNQIS